MSDKARADDEGSPPLDETDEPESWLREAARAPLPARLPKRGDIVGGKYRIEEQLGRGGMGVVFRAHHVVSEKPVALKLMLRPTTDERAWRRFEREARAAGRIDHPNVVTLYDVGDEGECSYLVMELLHGESLRERLRKGPIAPGEAVDLLIPAMRGVAAAHRAGVVHRDLKPDNIFLCQEREGGKREAKVLDFGVSSITSLEAVDSTLTQEGTLLGSLAYMSPEQLRNPHDVDARTDVYAFGVILYEVLTGGLPFEGVTPSAMIVAVATTQPKRPSLVQTNLPPGLEDVIMRALARDCDNRYPGMNSLIEALLPHAAPARDSAAVAEVAPGVRTATPQRETEPSLPGTLVVPAPESSAGLAPARGPRFSSRWRVVLALASLLLVLVWWALSDRSALVETPVSIRPPPPASPPTQPALEQPPRAPEAPAGPAASAPAAPLPAAAHAPAKPPRSRAPRSTSAARGGMKPAKPKVDSSEDALFPGRK